MRYLFLLTLIALSCRLLTPASSPPTAAPIQVTVPAPTVVPPIPALTADMIRNAQYQINARDDHAIVQLTDGQFGQGSDPAALDFVSVFVSDFIAFGDVNGDGVDEAAAIVYENSGGTGNFAVLALYRNENGTPVFVTATFIDDRAMINELTFDDDEVFLDAVVHGFEDPGCCPALPTTRRYALVNDRLRLINLATATPNGDKREIDIVSPVNGVEAADSVQVTGNVTIAPFENNLAYRIYDAAGTELDAGPVQVIAPDLGAPGTFETVIDLASIAAGTMIFIELQDISMADGSLIAMDSVQLVVK